MVHDLQARGVALTYTSSSTNIFEALLPELILVVLIIGVFVFMSRRAQGQMGAVMNIGRSRAKVYIDREAEDDVRRRGRLRAR